ncbi:hypothetical protein CI109_104456 [Kwoniella shandongensis]|uniref:catechol O-methyltransferase n=1 Tax=Kwoniella shandongensis TaxID=1734106 RepID=A0AAJ8LJU9_9TREE
MTVPPPKYHEPVQGTVFHGDGREEELLQHLQSLSELTTESTSDLSLHDRSQRVLDAIHEFGKRENRYLMSVGDTKGRQVEELIREKKPKLILELGSYVGYSAISFSRHLPELHPSSIYPADWSKSNDPNDDRAGYVSLEKSDVYGTTARGALKLAGLDRNVKIVIGGSSSSLRSLRKTLNMPRPMQFDMVFLDHLKPLYTIDLKVMEEEGLVGPGTILVADNVVKPGNPAYLSWVRATPAQKRHSLTLGPLTKQPAPTPNPSDADWQEAFRSGPIDETRWVPDEAEGVKAQGDPALKYTSKMLDGWDPYTGEKDACEVSECIGRED